MNATDQRHWDKEWEDTLSFVRSNGEPDDTAHKIMGELYKIQRCGKCMEWVPLGMSHCVSLPRQGRPFSTETCYCGAVLGLSAYQMHRAIHQAEKRIEAVTQSADKEITKAQQKRDRIVERKQARIAALQAQIDKLEAKRLGVAPPPSVC